MKMRTLLSATVALPLLLTSLSFALLPATSAIALPQNTVCIITTYYNNSAFDEEVGTRTKCTGSPMHMTGRATPWHTSEREVLDQGGAHPPGGPGGLPCEFLAAGCSNLPTVRYE